MSHFDLPGLRYAVAKAQNSNFGAGSCAMNGAKAPYLNADLGVGSCFGPLQKRSTFKFFFPQNFIIFILAILTNVISSYSSGDFF